MIVYYNLKFWFQFNTESFEICSNIFLKQKVFMFILNSSQLITLLKLKAFMVWKTIVAISFKRHKCVYWGEKNTFLKIIYELKTISRHIFMILPSSLPLREKQKWLPTILLLEDFFCLPSFVNESFNSQIDEIKQNHCI